MRKKERSKLRFLQKVTTILVLSLDASCTQKIRARIHLHTRKSDCAHLTKTYDAKNGSELASALSVIKDAGRENVCLLALNAATVGISDIDARRSFIFKDSVTKGRYDVRASI